MSTIYAQDKSHPNNTGVIPRQARITGQFKEDLEAQKAADRISVSAYIMGVVGLLMIVMACFV